MRLFLTGLFFIASIAGLIAEVTRIVTEGKPQLPIITAKAASPAVKTPRAVLPELEFPPVDPPALVAALARPFSGRARTKNQEPRTKNQEPRTKNQEPRTKNQELPPPCPPRSPW